MKLKITPSNWNFSGNQKQETSSCEFYIEDFTGSKEYYNKLMTFAR